SKAPVHRGRRLASITKCRKSHTASLYAAIRPSVLYPPSSVFSLSTPKSNKPPANPDVVFRTQPLILLAALVHFLALPKGICTGSRLIRNPRGLKLSSGLANLSRKSSSSARTTRGIPPALRPAAKARDLP